MGREKTCTRLEFEPSLPKWSKCSSKQATCIWCQQSSIWPYQRLSMWQCNGFHKLKNSFYVPSNYLGFKCHNDFKFSPFLTLTSHQGVQTSTRFPRRPSFIIWLNWACSLEVSLFQIFSESVSVRLNDCELNPQVIYW